MKLKGYMVIALFTILLSCSEELEVTPFTFPQIFTGETQKSWVMRSFQIVREGRGTITVQPSDIFDECIADDVYTFYFDEERTYEISNGALKCSSDEPELVVESSWDFVNSTASLMIIMPVFGSNPIPFTVSDVDETKLVLDAYLDDNRKYRLHFRTTSGD